MRRLAAWGEGHSTVDGSCFDIKFLIGLTDQAMHCNLPVLDARTCEAFYLLQRIRTCLYLHFA